MSQSNTPSKVRSFEIQTKYLGDWKYDSIYDDLDLAMEQARILDIRNSKEFIRILEEVFDDDSPVSKIRVVYTTEPLDNSSKNSLSDGRTFGAHDGEAEEDAEADEVDDAASDMPLTPQERAAAAAARRKSGMSPLMLGIVLILILGAGLAVLIGLEYLIAMSDEPAKKSELLLRVMQA